MYSYYSVSFLSKKIKGVSTKHPLENEVIKEKLKKKKWEFYFNDVNPPKLEESTGTPQQPTLCHFYHKYFGERI